jgi:nucleoside phosphorylase
VEKPYVDLGFIIPLHEEFQRLERLFAFGEQHVDGIQFSTRVDLGVPGLKAVAFLQDDMGKAAATRAANALIARFDVGAIFLIGIAGGLSGDVAIGDVCFSGDIIDVLENTKVSEKGKQTKLEYDSRFYDTDPLLTFALKYAKIGADVRPAFEAWQSEQAAKAKVLIPGQFIGRKDKNEVVGMPQIHDGSIVCGLVSKSDVYKSDLKLISRKVLALETEAGGVFHSAEQAKIPTVAIRGVCDYADKNKNKLEEQTEGQGRNVAADNAMTFVKMQLKNPQLLRYLAARRSDMIQGAAPLLPKEEPAEFARSSLDKIKDSIHSQLGHLSPEYRGKPRGYRVPVPRLKPSAAEAAISPATRKTDPQDALSAIASHRVVFIEVPRTYPDNSLPWVLASEVALIEIDGKQAVPLVIDGQLIKPPAGKIAAAVASEVDFAKLHACPIARPVVILAEFPLTSRVRTEILREEIEKYPEARFVVVNRADPKVAADKEALVAIGATQFGVTEISFVEMSSFFQRTFQMEDQEAGVAALRLHEMFKKFDLSAHPSYFAGVGADVLTALLRANRRAELLELAVTGFLSFVVASDKSDVVLGRTTREEFLRSLIFEKNVNKKNFDRAALVKFVEELAIRRDYDLDPIEFINGFQEKGIIFFEEDGVRVALPFIESYLLAVELAARPADAKRYFNLALPDFDGATFDIYCELGPSAEIVSGIAEDLERAILELAPSESGTNILLTNEIRPPILDRREQLRGVEERLQKAFEDVVFGRPNSHEKQQLLDLAYQVEEGAKAAQEKQRLESDKNSDAPEMDQAGGVLGAAIILLGSGSERLDKAPKRKLAELIVRLSARILDRLLRTFPTVKFDEFKKELQEDSNIRKLFGIPEDQQIDENQKSYVSVFVDAYEFSLAGMPVRALLEYLGNAAGQPVLRTSVASVVLEDRIENLLARVWAAEIDAAKEKGRLLEAIHALPPVPFLLTVLYQHFTERVFWNHWQLPNRLALLDAAEQAVTALGGSIDKGRVKRLITKTDAED